MSYRTMLKHRCTVLRLVETQQNGYDVHVWQQVGTNVPCWLDLNFIRQGKDPQWTPEAGRAADRTGVWFGMPLANVRSGDRLVMSKGPVGTFAAEGAVDTVWRPKNFHHLELGVKEVAKSILGKPS